MELSGKHVVITGAASGIGAGLAERFHAEGANVVAADRDGGGAEVIAAKLEAARANSAFAVTADVGSEAGNVALIAAATERFGPIDLFFANAGVGLGQGLDTPEDTWQVSWDVNVNAHRWAAKHLVPEWLARGEGYFCSTASAAGLLSQIGSAPYTLSKHAAVSFAEWLAITFGDQGIRVSCLCPQGVNTNLLRNSGGGGSRALASVGAAAVRASGKVLEPADVAEVCVQVIRDETFLILPHPEVLTYLQRKTGDVDRWLAGMRKLQARMA